MIHCRRLLNFPSRPGAVSQMGSKDASKYIAEKSAMTCWPVAKPEFRDEDEHIGSCSGAARLRGRGDRLVADHRVDINGGGLRYCLCVGGNRACPIRRREPGNGA